jgi:hypothetical protein
MQKQLKSERSKYHDKTWYYLKGTEGVVQYMFFKMRHHDLHVADIGIHSKTPLTGESLPFDEHCPVLDGPCYFICSTKLGEKLYQEAQEDKDAIWRGLRTLYVSTFGDE